MVDLCTDVCVARNSALTCTCPRASTSVAVAAAVRVYDQSVQIGIDRRHCEQHRRRWRRQQQADE